MLEVFLNQINFEDDLENIPDHNNFKLKVKFSNLLNINLDPKAFPESIKKRDERCWGLNIGESCIFAYHPQSLRAELTKFPLEILLKNNKDKILGKADFPWKKEFSDMVNIFEQIGVVKSVDHSNTIEIKNRDKIIGNIRIYIRMGCGGDGLETDIRQRNDLDENNWILMHTKTMTSVVCEGYTPEEDEIIPIARLYNTTLTPPHYDTTNLSWVKSPRQAKKSDEFDMMELYAGSSAFDVISVCFTPNTNFFDMLSTEGSRRSRRNAKGREDEEKTKMTVNDICNRLCQHADCPGVKKFEELGIQCFSGRKDPSGLEPQNQHILTHANRNLEKYSPQSAYMTPKNPDFPFISPGSSGVCSCKLREQVMNYSNNISEHSYSQEAATDPPRTSNKHFSCPFKKQRKTTEDFCENQGLTKRKRNADKV